MDNNEENIFCKINNTIIETPKILITNLLDSDNSIDLISDIQFKSQCDGHAERSPPHADPSAIPPLMGTISRVYFNLARPLIYLGLSLSNHLLVT